LPKYVLVEIKVCFPVTNSLKRDETGRKAQLMHLVLIFEETETPFRVTVACGAGLLRHMTQTARFLPNKNIVFKDPFKPNPTE